MNSYAGDATSASFFSQDKIQLGMVVADMLCFLPGLCLDWRPDGFFFRDEYMSNHPDHEDEEHSLCINLRTGRWTDIASNAQGFDPVSYYAHINDLPLDEAFEILVVELELESLLGRTPRVLM